MYAIHSSFKELPFIDFTRSVIDPEPQNSITSHNCSTWRPADEGSFLMKAAKYVAIFGCDEY
jgi:hypothetical protein